MDSRPLTCGTLCQPFIWLRKMAPQSDCSGGCRFIVFLFSFTASIQAQHLLSGH